MRWFVLPSAAALLVSLPALAEPTARFADPPLPPPPSAQATPSEPAPSRATGTESWARSASRGLVERAERLARRGDVADAMRVYNDAIRMDPSYGAAYIGLGRLRQAQRDYAEAERLYGAAARLPATAAEALGRRAQVRRELGRDSEALEDLRTAVDLDPAARERMRLLASWYVEKKAWPAALGVWRRLAAVLEATGPSDELKQAKVQIQALSMLAGDTDPVAGGRHHPSWVRRSISTIARQR